MKWTLAQDYSITMAADRESAVSIFRKDLPLVVTLDLGLPPQPASVEEVVNTLTDILNQDSITKVV